MIPTLLMNAISSQEFLQFRDWGGDSQYAEYRGWSIITQVHNGKLWLHWQHPEDPFPRYGCAALPEEINTQLPKVLALIDLAIELEGSLV